MKTDQLDFKKLREKWSKRWSDSGLYMTDYNGTGKEKYYVLDMFPYPSGDGLHMGHTESYTASDIIYRYKRMRGYNVLHPQGFDAFGLPAENYAIQTGIHPKNTTETNSNNYIAQMKLLGLGHDLNNLIYTSSPEYYKWTQWLFGKFFENGLVERKTDMINWCPSCNTGLANEQVENGACERCGTAIEQREVRGWFFKITDFAEDLIEGLDDVDWPETTKKNQINWIGKSKGALLKFAICSLQFSNNDLIPNHKIADVEIFTTRPDTVFGATYLVLSPEHELIENLKSEIENWDEVAEYIEKAKNKTEMERLESKEKTGVELKGIKAINPARKKAGMSDTEIPIFIADYVLGGYGTGAIMAVPAHDVRDFEFATKLGLPIIRVIECGEGLPCTNGGKLVNSGEFDGMNNEETKQAMVEFVGGKESVNFRLKDWSVSRQRYWGCPIPIVYSPEGEARYVGDENLPWVLPEDVDFIPTGTAPLAKSRELKERTEKLFGEGWVPEVDTMDTFVDSSWYFFRYADPNNDNEFCSKDMLEKWLPVDLYIGGAEHTYMHLLYARFFTHAMHKIGLIKFKEPFRKLRHQGMVLDAERKKMSKSKGNVVNPNDMVEKFGADAVRLQMMFAGPLEDDVIWDENGVTGVSRFLDKIWRAKNYVTSKSPENISKHLHKTIKKVSEDIEDLKFNTAIAEMMKFINVLEKEKRISRDDFNDFVKILSPFAPFIAEELYEYLQNKGFVIESSWPSYDPDKIIDENITIAVQVNGKVRAQIEVRADASEEEIKSAALADENVNKWIHRISDGEVKRFIYIAGRVANIVV